MTAFYGLRRSEVLGIRWSAIDFENKTITISKTTERYTHLDSSTKINSASAIEKALSFNTNTDIKTNKKDILDLDSNTSTNVNISNC